MTSLFWLVAAGGISLASAGYIVWRKSRAIGLDQWFPGYVATWGRRRAPAAGSPIHVFLCIADHYEPKGGGVDPDAARARVRRWVQEYPARFTRFQDSDGAPPKHTFFYPAEEYEEHLLDELQHLCAEGFGEIEVHLHHDKDTAENLTRQLLSFKETLATRHGALGRDRRSGDPGYVFIHGNWALDNSRLDGCWCGVNNELSILEETGCYADMTFPSAPSTTQPPTINAIYRAIDDPERPRSHDYGVRLKSNVAPTAGLLMVTGPLVLNWARKKLGLLPGIENSCLQWSQPPSAARLNNWLRAGVSVDGRPDWYFVKLHTHGAVERNADVLLGKSMENLHAELAARAAADSNFHFHYVTAREMVNVILAAEAGESEWRHDLRDFRWAAPTFGREASHAADYRQEQFIV